jgi:hypothetical protein
MATLLSAIETQARRHLVESTASFWSSAELVDIINKGIKDLWRDIVDLKQEHYLTVDNTNVSLAASTSTLTGVPTDVHKVYLIEPRDVSNTSTSRNLIFKPLDYNHVVFQGARTANAIDPTNAVIYYAVTGTGTPVAAPTIYVAPQVSSLADKTAADNVPIPGEADNAVIAWTVAFARAKERDDRSPDPSWLAIYATEKQHLLESLGLRQYQEAQIVDAMFEEYWSS